MCLAFEGGLYLEKRWENYLGKLQNLHLKKLKDKN